MTTYRTEPLPALHSRHDLGQHDVRRDRDDHMHVIRGQHALLDANARLIANLPDDLAWGHAGSCSGTL